MSALRARVWSKVGLHPPATIRLELSSKITRLAPVSGVDLHDPRFIDVLRNSFREHAPDGYDAWLDKNLAYYDPIFRDWHSRDSMPSTSRPQRSHKCWDDRCMHYIYGYPHQDARDLHAREHVAPSKRDSGLSVGDTPSLLFTGPPSSSRGYSGDYSKQTSPVYLPRPGAAAFQLAPLSTGVQSKDHRDSLRSYSFVSEYPGGPRSSVDSEVDPLLPPLKRSRVGQSRLESIEELKLLRDSGPCLRCKVSDKSVRTIVRSPILDTWLTLHSATRTTLAPFVLIAALQKPSFGNISAALVGHWQILPRSCCQVRLPGLDCLQHPAL